MSNSIVPFTGRHYAIDRATSRGLAEIDLGRDLAVSNENALADIALIRCRNGIQLLERATLGLAAVDSVISACSHDRPGLELILRGLESDVALGIGSTIRGYVQR